MDNFIYFAVGFKSFDIERLSRTSGIWFEWTERSRKAALKFMYKYKSRSVKSCGRTIKYEVF